MTTFFAPSRRGVPTSIGLTPPPAEVPGRVLFKAVFGSHAHGTATPTSDEDWRGVYLLPSDSFLGLDRPVTTYEAKPDQVYWELGHFCRLLLKGNPNIVGMLWCPQDCVSFYDDPVLNPLWKARRLFVHRDTIRAYMGWAHRELRDLERMRTGNAKRLSHVPRLLWEIESAVTTGEIAVRAEGYKLETILAIKTGAMAYLEGAALTGSLLLDVEKVVAEREPEMPDPPREWTQDYLLRTRRLYGGEG